MLKRDIYRYCVAKPHTQRLTSPSPETNNSGKSNLKSGNNQLPNELHMPS